MSAMVPMDAVTKDLTSTPGKKNLAAQPAIRLYVSILFHPFMEFKFICKYSIPNTYCITL